MHDANGYDQAGLREMLREAFEAKNWILVAELLAVIESDADAERIFDEALIPEESQRMWEAWMRNDAKMLLGVPLKD